MNNKSNKSKNNRIYKYTFKGVYPLYVEKIEKKGRSQAELDEIIKWLTGYSQKELESLSKNEISLEAFVNDAPKLNPNRKLIKGIICGVRVEDLEDPIVQTVRYMDKLVDELAKGRPIEKILRKV